VADLHVSVTPELERALDALAFDENARRSYEYLSGGFFWSDEVAPELMANDNATLMFKLLIARRTAMIRGEEKPEAAQWWNEMKRRFPNWPGFRPERCSHLLAEELRRVEQRIMAKFENL
jgi:hypothetical protein